MPFHPRTSGRMLLASFLLTLTVVLLSTAALAQEVETPKYDLFVGYQWLHPGGTVPAPPVNFNSPSSLKIPDMPKGFGTAFTYNWTRFLGVGRRLRPQLG